MFEPNFIMKKFFLLGFIIYSSHVFAQVTVNQHPDINSFFLTDGVDYSQINFQTEVKPTGGNQVWKFDSLDLLGLEDTVYYVNPNLFGAGTLATGSNLAIVDYNNFLSTLTFAKVTNSDMHILGFSEDGDNYIEYKDPYLINKFPLNFNDEIEGSTKFDITDPMTGKFEFELENFSRVDSWGDISTPLGKFACLKLKTTSTLQITFGGFPVGNATIEEYKWISPGFDYDVFRYVVAEQEFAGDLENDTLAIYLADQIILSNKTPKIDKVDIQISPNPASEFAQISISEKNWTGKAELIIYNLEAKEQYRQNLTQPNHSINVSTWPKGTYMVRVNAGVRNWGLQRLIVK